MRRVRTLKDKQTRSESVSLPTGCRKSLIYAILPLVTDKIRGEKAFVAITLLANEASYNFDGVSKAALSAISVT